MGDIADQHLEQLYGLEDGDFFYCDLFRRRRTFKRSKAKADEAAIDDFFDEPIPIAKWTCRACGSHRWVGHRYGQAHKGYRRNAQCIPCGHVQELPAGAGQ